MFSDLDIDLLWLKLGLRFFNLHDHHREDPVLQGGPVGPSSNQVVGFDDDLVISKNLNLLSHGGRAVCRRGDPALNCNTTITHVATNVTGDTQSVVLLSEGGSPFGLEA
jgi:hypothetical protein